MRYTKTTKRHHAKVLKALLTARQPFHDTVSITKEFYRKCHLSQQKVEESLVALAGENVIELIPPGRNSHPTVKLLQAAYAYFPNRGEARFHFWFPVSLSILAIFISMIALLK